MKAGRVIGSRAGGVVGFSSIGLVLLVLSFAACRAGEGASPEQTVPRSETVSGATVDPAWGTTVIRYLP